ncbi:hypothetical protein ACFL5V_04600 [Fibrobacterota bacterium]
MSNFIQRNNSLIRLSCLLAGIVILSVNLYVYRGYNVDDTYIPLRYADNYNRTGDLSFNPGERILGFTSYLHMGFLLLESGMGLAPFSLIRCMTVLSALALVFSLFCWERKLVNKTSALVLAPILMSLYYPVALWGQTPLESMVLVFLLFQAGMYAVFGSFQKWGRLNWICCMTGVMALRPEGFLAGVLFWGMVCVRSVMPKGRLLRMLLINLIPLAVLFGWFWYYYGSPVPNTFQAKTGSVFLMVRRGLGDYFHHFQAFWPAYIGGFGVLIAAWRHGLRTRASLFLAGTQVVAACYVLYVGGDWMPGFRFILLQVPFFILLVCILWHDMPSPAFKLISMALIFCGLILTLPFRFRVATPMDPGAPFVAEYIKLHKNAGDQMAIWDVGIIPRQAEIYTIDLGGLNSRKIVREFPRGYHFNRYDPGTAQRFADSLLSWRPRYIVLKEKDGKITHEGIGVQLDRSAEFHALYKRLPLEQKSIYGIYETEESRNGFREEGGKHKR